jgi:hypothetical protein
VKTTSGDGLGTQPWGQAAGGSCRPVSCIAFANNVAVVFRIDPSLSRKLASRPADPSALATAISLKTSSQDLALARPGKGKKNTKMSAGRNTVKQFIWGASAWLLDRHGLAVGDHPAYDGGQFTGPARFFSIFQYTVYIIFLQQHTIDPGGKKWTTKTQTTQMAPRVRFFLASCRDMRRKKKKTSSLMK